MVLRHGFEVKPLSGGGYELIPTQFLFAVANTEESAWELAKGINALVDKFNAEEWAKVNKDES
jgi:hypothetical protein